MCIINIWSGSPLERNKYLTKNLDIKYINKIKCEETALIIRILDIRYKHYYKIKIDGYNFDNVVKILSFAF